MGMSLALVNFTSWATISQTPASHQEILDAVLNRIRFKTPHSTKSSRPKTYAMVNHISFQWLPAERVSDFKACPERETCILRSQKPAKVSYSVTSHERFRHEEWHRILQPIAPQINVSVTAPRFSPPFSIAFYGKSIRTIIFKPLAWKIQGHIIKSSKSKSKSYLRHTTFTAILPVVRPAGHLDGAFTLLDICNPPSNSFHKISFLNDVHHFFCSTHSSK
ncbi:hypothetical protein DSO57_1018393 [Entomophthora muscae]|uniref:Uncharacterized protein n=1 Tax=Entomophthora muscae TaxID=34485 RepID=A0ACC2U254_9FUNG|nr:hypothetical protein DSO57_1018393 [Entomophthora muscae]